MLYYFIFLMPELNLMTGWFFPKSLLGLCSSYMLLSATVLFFRTYQPYVFQPNFLKQQIRQREVEKALQLGENAGTIQLTLRSNITGNPMTLPQHVVEEMMNRKKTGRKVIDWTPACTLYLEV